MPRGFEVDWVLIRVVTVRKIAAVAATLLVAGLLALFAHMRLNLPPDVEARQAIDRANEAHERILEQPIPDAWRGELGQAENQLESARSSYTSEAWEDAIVQARGARSRFEALMGASGHELVGVGQFFSLEGRVTVQRAGKAEWSEAHQRMPLFNGDFVKTSRDGSAEILFTDGTLYRISPNSLLEIHQPQRAGDTGSVKMEVGHITVHTSDQASTVTTASADTEVERDSRVSVGVAAEDQRTTVAAFHGGARVRSPQGQEVRVGTREQVASTADGELTAKTRVPDPPEPVDPQNNAGFELQDNPIIELSWRQKVADTRIHLQVSRSKRFLGDLLDVDAPSLKGASAKLRAIHPGTYYWRVAAVEGDGDVHSEWSPVRRFQVLSPNRTVVVEDRTPPELNVAGVKQLGHLFIVEGTTEPSATVTINGEAVELRGDGSFSKAIEATQTGWNELVISAVDPSGNRIEQRKRLYVEVF